MEVNINITYESENKSQKIKYKRKLSKRERIELWIKRIFLIAAVIVVIFPVFA